VSTPPAALLELRDQVDHALRDLYARVLPRLVDIHPALAPVADDLRAFTHGGKRIRPALLLLGFEAAGGRNRGAVMGPALALELLHTCALVHDDVIDRASTRRGVATIHEAARERHRAGGWAGDPDAYGEAVAILVGDLAFVHADEAFLGGDVPARELLDGFARFTVLREEVMAGQYLDLQAATTRVTDRDLALAVATLKSGRYSVARPLEIGAILAGADDRLVAGLGAFGDPLGRAFQVRDDLLGVFGEEATTGKSVASDLAEGKRTLVVAEAAARLDDADRHELEAGLGDPSAADPSTAARLRELLERSGGRAAAEAYVDTAIAEARVALAELGLAPAITRTLGEVAGYLGDRAA
jgi:geranylgeranyl diphosphate synthase, type I